MLIPGNAKKSHVISLCMFMSTSLRNRLRNLHWSSFRNLPFRLRMSLHHDIRWNLMYWPSKLEAVPYIQNVRCYTPRYTCTPRWYHIEVPGTCLDHKHGRS